MHLVARSRTTLAWASGASDSLSLRESILLLEMRTGARPFWASRTRDRLHRSTRHVFDWVLALIAEAGLAKNASGWMPHGGQRGRCATDRAEGHGRGLPGDAGALGPGSVSRQPQGLMDLAHLDRKRKRSRTDWFRRATPIRSPDSAPRFGLQGLEHALDLDTGAVVAAELHPTRADTTRKTTCGGRCKPRGGGCGTAEDPAECVTDMGYDSWLVLKARRRPLKSRFRRPS